MARSRNGATVGAMDHAGWAVLVTVASDGTLLDRRRVELVDEALPSMPHHHDALKLPLEEGVALVERVRASAERHAKRRLEALAADVTSPIVGLSLRECPELPKTVAERLASYWAQNRADWVMYREALAGAAKERGWAVRWYDPKRVMAQAGEALGIADVEAHLAQLGRSLGPPWQKDHKLAMAAAMAAQSMR